MTIRVHEGAAAISTVRVPSPLAEPRVEPEPVAFAVDSILPPRPGGEADRAWRAAFRQHVEERGSGDADLVPMIALLRRVPLFRGCNAAELEALARGAFVIGFDRGDRLCVEGAEALECYVIAEGEAECTIGGAIVATVGMDDVVGELGPLSGRPRAATVTATTHMVAYAISSEGLERLVASSPKAAAAIRADLDRRYRERQ